MANILYSVFVFDPKRRCGTTRFLPKSVTHDLDFGTWLSTERNSAFSEGELIAKEMADNICLDMAAKNLVTESITLWVGYSHMEGVPGATATAQFCRATNLAAEVIPAIAALFRRIVSPAYAIRRIVNSLRCRRKYRNEPSGFFLETA